jgi:hypothetical protein
MGKVEVAAISQQQAGSSKRGIRWRQVIEAKPRSQLPLRNMRPCETPTPESPSSNSVRDSVSPSTSTQLAIRLAYTLNTTAGTGYDIRVCGEWLPELACRIGRNNALDAAVETLLLAHRNLIERDSPDFQEQIRAYGQALTSLAAQLNDNGDNVDVETLCAVLALCTVEVSFQTLAQHTKN